MSRNPFTPLRRQLQELKGEVELMLQEVILLELYHQGAELALDDQGEVEVVEALKVEKPRRGRPRKVPPYAVPGLPEDMDHPLNTPPRQPGATWEPAG